MSNDMMPCGCEGHLDNEDLCRYPALREQAVRASAELRHAYAAKADWNLVARAIATLEKATTERPVDNFKHALEKENRRLNAEVERLTRERDANAAMVSTATQAGANLSDERDEERRMRLIHEEAAAGARNDHAHVVERLRKEVARADRAEADNAEFIHVLNLVENDVADGRPEDAQRRAVDVMMTDRPGSRLLKRLRAAEKVVEAFRAYIEDWGVQHGDIAGTEVECPEDDTCTCPHVLAINEAFAAVDAAKEGA